MCRPVFPNLLVVGEHPEKNSWKTVLISIIIQFISITCCIIIIFKGALQDCSGSICGPQSSGWEPLM